LIASDSGVPYRDPVKPIGIGFVIALIVLMGGAAVFSFVRGPTGPWRGAWFEDRDFKGASTIRYARNIDFDWKHESPMPGWPVDKWSVIWDTCLSVDDAGEYRFRTTSDDGTRLYVDEQLVVENWGARPTRTRSGKITLEAGVHHVRVEYFESSFTANVKVEAAFPEGEFGLLPIERLSRPGSDPPLCW
jgi:hypothetical protein